MSYVRSFFLVIHFFLLPPPPPFTTFSTIYCRKSVPYIFIFFFWGRTSSDVSSEKSRIKVDEHQKPHQYKKCRRGDKITTVSTYQPGMLDLFFFSISSPPSGTAHLLLPYFTISENIQQLLVHEP